MSVITDKSSISKKSIFSLTFIGVLLIASNLRAPITALGPVIKEIAGSFNLSSASMGLLNAMPLLIFALASPFAPALNRRLGLERSLLLAIILIVAGCFIRSLSGFTGLWGGTFMIGLGIAIANVLVVPLIKRDFPDDIARCVGLYAATMALIASLSSGISAPLSEFSGATWRMSVGIWVIPALLALFVWLKVSVKADYQSGVATQPSVSGTTSIWKSRVAWQVSLFMAMQTLVFYTLIDWYPSIANEHGISSSVAGLHLFIYQAVAVVANLSTAVFISRLKDQRVLGLICSSFIAMGVAGLLIMPDLSVLWLVLAGVGAGMSMVTCLSLFGLRTREHSDAGKLSGKAQCIGYLIGACGPYFAGILHEHYQTWNSTLICILVISIAQAYFAWQAGKDRYI